MNKKPLAFACASLLCTSATAWSCAATGSVNHNINNDCPVILSYDFDPGNPTDVVNSSVLNNSINGGTSFASASNDYGYTANGAFVSNQGVSPVSFSFNVASGKTIDLEGIQLSNYWTTEKNTANGTNNSSFWDYMDGEVFVNGNQVASTNNNTFSYIRGWRGESDGSAVSNAYWEFKSNSSNTASNFTLTVVGGDNVEIRLRSSTQPGDAFSDNNRLGMDGLQIHGCVTPEPSSSLFSGLAIFAFLLRRKRA